MENSKLISVLAQNELQVLKNSNMKWNVDFASYKDFNSTIYSQNMTLAEEIEFQKKNFIFNMFDEDGNIVDFPSHTALEVLLSKKEEDKKWKIIKMFAKVNNEPEEDPNLFAL